ncbi:hypothetical protein GGR58DRAFT_464427, partial [Xylaria digitata]
MRALGVLVVAHAVVHAQLQATPAAVPLYSCSDSSPFRLQCDHPSMISYCGGKGTCCNDDGSMQIVDNLHCGADVCTCVHIICN